MCWKYHGIITLAAGHLENLPCLCLFLAMHIDMYRWSLNEHSYNVKVQMAVQQGQSQCLWCHQVTKEAACWLILEEEQVNLSLVACVSKKVPETENVCPSSPVIVWRTKSSQPEACCAGWFGSSWFETQLLSIPRLQSLPVKDKQLETWAFPRALKWPLCLATLLPVFTSLALFWPLLWALHKNGEKPARITRSFTLSPAKSDLSLNQGSFIMHLPYMRLCWSLPQYWLNISFIVKTFERKLRSALTCFLQFVTECSGIFVLSEEEKNAAYFI